MFLERDFLMISALQHLLFCRRQWALIHLEGQWRENRLTVEGDQLHRSVDELSRRSETRKDLVVLRGVALWSTRLGLIGRSDVVEFHRREDDGREMSSIPEDSSSAASLGEGWQPFPVEYKRGKPKLNNCDAVQLCAQALCLEEMLAVEVTEGALFYGKRQARHAVVFDSSLRTETAAAVAELRRLLQSGVTPVAEAGPKCDQCSLLPICLPWATSRARSARSYVTRAQRAMRES